MTKTPYLIIALLSISLFATAQVKNEQIIGKWKLVALIDKNISEAEKLKRYTFTTDSLIYSSPKRNVKGSYKLNEKTGECHWYAANVENPIVLMLKSINQNTMHLWQATGITTVGVLKRIEE